MTNSNHSSTESADADDHFVDSVFDPHAHESDGVLINGAGADDLVGDPSDPIEPAHPIRANGAEPGVRFFDEPELDGADLDDRDLDDHYLDDPELDGGDLGGHGLDRGPDDLDLGGHGLDRGPDDLDRDLDDRDLDDRSLDGAEFADHYLDDVDHRLDVDPDDGYETEITFPVADGIDVDASAPADTALGAGEPGRAETADLDAAYQNLDSVADELAMVARSLAADRQRSPEELAADLAERVGIDLERGQARSPGGEAVRADASELATAGVDPARVVAPPGVQPPMPPGPHVPPSIVSSTPPVMASSNPSDQPVPPAHPNPPMPDAVPAPPPVTHDPALARPPRPAPDPPPAQPAPAAHAEVGAHPVDQVAVRKLGGFNFMSVGQWTLLPRDERARLIKAGSVLFLYEGDEVPLRSALLWFQRLARAERPGPDDPPVRGARR